MFRFVWCFKSNSTTFRVQARCPCLQEHRTTWDGTGKVVRYSSVRIYHKPMFPLHHVFAVHSSHIKLISSAFLQITPDPLTTTIVILIPTPYIHRTTILILLYNLTLRLLMSYIYWAPSKARNANVVYIWTYVWQCWNSLFLFAAQCFNTESMQRGFLCHICV